MKEIGDELRGFRARGAFGREEFGSEVPKHSHPYDSGDHRRETTLLLWLSSLLNLPFGLWRRHFFLVLSDANARERI